MTDFENIKNDMISYYGEVSYGSISFDIRFYPDDGSWLRLPHNRKYYGENTPPKWMTDENTDQFINDAISISDEIIEFTKYDYDAKNGRGIAIFIHPDIQSSIKNL